MIDDRKPIEPDLFAFRPKGNGEWSLDAVADIARSFEGNAVGWFRLTIINDEHPKPPYPHGVYFEGWSVSPYKMDPPCKEAEFSFPLTPARS